MLEAFRKRNPQYDAADDDVDDVDENILSI